MSREACRFPVRYDRLYPRRTLLGPGGDSTAFLVEDTSQKVFKVFDKLGPLNPDNKKRLEAYMQAMRAMKAVIDAHPNPLLQQVTIDGTAFNLSYRVADPGQIISGKLDEHLVTVADFIEGENALEKAEIITDPNPIKNRVKAVNLPDKNGNRVALSEKESQDLRLEIVRLLMHFNSRFQMSWDNFKIELDRSKQVINIVITDAIVKIDRRFKPHR